MVEVVSGLNVGEQVVSSGGFYLKSEMLLAGRRVTWLCQVSGRASALHHPDAGIGGLNALPLAKNKPSHGKNHMLAQLIKLTLENRFLVLTGTALMAVAGLNAALHLPIDAVPGHDECSGHRHYQTPARCHRSKSNAT